VKKEIFGIAVGKDFVTVSGQVGGETGEYIGGPSGHTKHLLEQTEGRRGKNRFLSGGKRGKCLGVDNQIGLTEKKCKKNAKGAGNEVETTHGAGLILSFLPTHGFIFS